MMKRFWHATRLLLASVSLTLGACQPLPATVAPATALAPTDVPPQITAMPSAAPAPTDTPQPTPAPNTRILWVFQTEGPIWGTPTISDGTVYSGSDDGNLYAIEAQSGLLRWKFVTQGIVRSRPAISDGLAYSASDDGYLYAVDTQNGKQAWRTDIGNAMPREQRENLGTSTDPTGYDYWQSSPVVASGQVYVGSIDGNVYALAADTGKINWMFKTDRQVRATPTVDNGTLYVGSWDKSVYALDALTGQVRWQTPVGGQVQTTALVADGTVYCASRKASVVALDAQTGKITWESGYGTNMWVESSPRLKNGILYIGSSGSKWVVGLDSQTGEILTTFMSNAFNWSTPAIGDDTLYIGGTSFRHGDRGGLFALKLVDGKLSNLSQDQWHLPISETLEAAGDWSGVASSPVVADGVVYFGGLDGALYAVK